MEDAKKVEDRCHKAALKGVSSPDPRDKPVKVKPVSGRPAGWPPAVPPGTGAGTYKAVQKARKGT